MSIEKRSTRLGAAILIFATMLRLGGGITEASSHNLPLSEPVRTVLQRWPQGAISAAAVQLPPTTQPPEPVVLRPVFTAAELEQLTIRYGSGCKHRPDLAALIQSPLSWDLDSGEPTVLILHSHGSECYTRVSGEDYEACGDFRTCNTEHNLVAVGDVLTQLLEAAGIRVIHDRSLHDIPSYNAAYANARKAAKAYLEEYPSIQLVLDLHRDAATYADGSQYATGVTVDGQRIAQLMLVMGSDSAGLPYPNWQENFSVALKVLAQLEQLAPGITRTTTLRASRYNQDLHPAMLLVEVGSAGNTLAQAKAAAEILAQAIIALKDGANEA